MKATQTKEPVAMSESKDKPTDREPAVPHDKGGERPRRVRRRFTTIDDDWSRLRRQRGRLKDALLTDREILEAAERTQPTKIEAVAEPKYEATDYERAVLAKQAERSKDQARVPRIKFVEDQRGGRFEFNHPDQSIAFALLNEVFGTADDQSAKGLLHYLCTALPADEYSAYDYPRADDLNRAISLIAAGKAVDELHAEILADRAVCRITIERLLHNVREPLRFDLSPELKYSLYYYQYNPKDKIDREVKIDNRPVLEFSLRHAIRLMALSTELLAAADRHRAIVELSRKVRPRSAVRSTEASLGGIRHAAPSATPKKANTERARRFNGSAIPKQKKADSIMARKSNGHRPT